MSTRLIKSALVAGTNITITPNDTDSELTVAADEFKVDDVVDTITTPADEDWLLLSDQSHAEARNVTTTYVEVKEDIRQAAEDEGDVIDEHPDHFNFTGTGVTVTDDGAGVEVNIPASGGGGGGTGSDSIQFLESTEVGGTANAHVLTPSTAVSSLSGGQGFRYFVETANTGAITVAVSSIAAKALVRADLDAFASGNLTVGQSLTIVYDTTNDRFVAPNVGSGGGGGGGMTDIYGQTGHRPRKR